MQWSTEIQLDLIWSGYDLFSSSLALNRRGGTRVTPPLNEWGGANLKPKSVQNLCYPELGTSG